MRFKATVLALATTILATPAIAGPEIDFGARPDWVVPRTPAKPTAQAQPDAMQLLLQDTQIRFEDDNSQTYQRFVTRIGNPDGLANATFSIEWNPETEDVVVHKLELRREGETVNILEDGPEFLVLRRETELEQATLNGHLTAHLQPEGVEVGDTLEMELTITSRDPVVSGHAGEYVGLGDTGNHGQRFVRLLYPASREVAVKTWPETPEPVRKREGDWETLSWSNGKLEPLTVPENAPLRYRVNRTIEYSDYGSWNALAATLIPYFDQAATIEDGSRLAAEVDKIAAASDDPVRRAEMALDLVQSRVRYVNMALGAGGLIPVDAETTWKRRFGDCKGKTVLLIAMLDRLGIEAVPSLVKAEGDDSIGEGLPMIDQFDHVIAKTTIDGKTYWLDGTRQGDTRLALIEVPDMDWTLPLTANTDIERLVVRPAAQPTRHIDSFVDMSAGPLEPAKMSGAAHFYGAEATLLERNWEAVSEQMRRNIERMAENREGLGRYTTELTGRDYDEERGELTVRYQIVSEDPYILFHDEMTVASPAFFVAEERDNVDFNAEAPFSLSHPMFNRMGSTIVLPSDHPGIVVAVGDSVTHDLNGQRFVRSVARGGGKLEIVSDMQSLTSEVAYASALSSKERAEALNRDRAYYDLRLWTMTGDEIDRLVTFADDLDERSYDDDRLEDRAESFAKDIRHQAAIAYERDGKGAKAAALFDSLRAKAKDAMDLNQLCWDKAVANVAIDRALEECDAAIAMSRVPAILDSRALVYARLGRWTDAEADYDEALEDLDEDEGALFRYGRGLTRQALGRTAEGKADTDQALSHYPMVAAVYDSYAIAMPKAEGSD